MKHFPIPPANFFLGRQPLCDFLANTSFESNGADKSNAHPTPVSPRANAVGSPTHRGDRPFPRSGPYPFFRGPIKGRVAGPCFRPGRRPYGHAFDLPKRQRPVPAFVEPGEGQEVEAGKTLRWTRREVYRVSFKRPLSWVGSSTTPTNPRFQPLKSAAPRSRDGPKNQTSK